MAATVRAPEHHPAGPPQGHTGRFRSPGWSRALLWLVIGVAFGFALDMGVRLLLGYKPLYDGEAAVTVSLLAAPLFFLVGLGLFDYWFYWAAGKPTAAEDHSGHGAKQLEGLLPPQHRPQGDRDPVRRARRSSSCSSAA